MNTLSPGYERICYPVEYKEKRENAEVKERERARKTFSERRAEDLQSHTRTQWRKSLTWMIAADQLVGREVSFSKSGFQFPKGAYTAYTDGIAFSSEFASGVTDRRLLENKNAPTECRRILLFCQFSSYFFFFSSCSLFRMTRRWFETPREDFNRVYS